MKDWKFIKVENKDTPELRSKLRDIEEQIKNWEHAKSISGVDQSKAQKIIDDLRKDREKLKNEIATGNESIDKQEWSMFNGLKKDAEKEIGNAIGDEYNAEIERLERKKEQLRRMGQGSQAMEIDKQIEKLQKELRELGNKKTGNQSAQDRLLDDIEFIKDDYKKSGKKLSFGLLLYELNRYGWDDYELRKLKIPTNIGNEETKAERKFGKVMGEFEEGALKTPQGKTVTDPAQAKAIAYSEADKVDNLKRARNAMNKKVKNSSVREYKDSQGRIAQIDFNSDGTDADMAIYEDERMSKSVEQRNFSTIRDAEQYVQSHGFRRVG